ncbi:MAG TPA: hypothetical protein PKD54_13330 [Pirellulaceae bacterium]|nr:hypothetical protein [Pirellulaceae bacterium]
MYKTLLTMFAICFVLVQPTVGQINEDMDQIEAMKAQWEQEHSAIQQIKGYGGWVVIEDVVPELWREFFDEGRRQFVVEVNMVYHRDEEGWRTDNKIFDHACFDAIAQFHQVRKILVSQGQVSDQALAKIAHLRNVEAMYMWNAADVSDQGVAHLSGFKELMMLHLSGSQITSVALEHLSALPKLEHLSLQGNSFDDDVFRHAAKIKSLKVLWVGNSPRNRITDDGLAHLASCENLEVLDIQGTGVTDAGLKHLERLSNLKKLYYSGSQVTDAGFEALRSKIPALETVR